MANPTLIGNRESGSNEYKSRLRSHQAPLRRSPRFLPEINNNNNTATPLTTPSNNQPINSTTKTDLKSPSIFRNPTLISTPRITRQRCSMKCCSGPLRSIENLCLNCSSANKRSSSCKTHVKFSPNLTNPTPMFTPKKTQPNCSTKRLEEPLRSMGNLQGSLRRSRSLSSFTSFESGKDSAEPMKERRRSLRLMTFAKVLEGKEDVGTDGLTEVNLNRKELVDTVKEKWPLYQVMSSVKVSEGKENVVSDRLNDENCRSFGKECIEHVKETKQSPRLRCSVKISEGKENVGSDGLHDDNYIGFAKERVRPTKEKRRSLPLMGSAKVLEGKEKMGTDGLNDGSKDDTNLNARVVKGMKVLEQEKAAIVGHVNLKRKRETICEQNTESEKVYVGDSGDFGGWTREQEVALQKAYLVAKPSPHFWKKVAKMVPGKSAQECFDRVNGSIETPLQTQPRSRSKRSNLSPISNFSLSASKSIQHPMPSVKKLSSRKKSLVAQKTVRHLLRKHSINDQNHEADHFSVLETSPAKFAVDLSEITSPITSPCLFQKYSGGSSSAHKKMLSRFTPLSRANRPSPEVLKRIKNMVLHEKYIDQLHTREARRKFAAARSVDRRVKEGEAKTGVLEAARSALVSEAREVISQFQHKQANCESSTDIDGDDDDVDDEE